MMSLPVESFISALKQSNNLKRNRRLCIGTLILLPAVRCGKTRVPFRQTAKQMFYVDGKIHYKLRHFKSDNALGSFVYQYF